MSKLYVDHTRDLRSGAWRLTSSILQRHKNVFYSIYIRSRDTVGILERTSGALCARRTARLGRNV